MKRIPKFVHLVSCLLMTSSCADGAANLFDPSKNDLIDPYQKHSRDDYRNMYDGGVPGTGDASGETPLVTAGVLEPEIPDLAEILAAPKPPKIGETQLVSVAVTDDVPLKDVLIELARLAEVDIELDSGITGGVSLRAKDRPFNEVIDRISDLAGLRYTMKNNVLRVERDTPYIQIYSLDFLNLERSSSGTVSVSTNVLSSGTTGSSSGGSSSGGSSGGSSSGSTGGGLNTGSTASITTTAESDFWQQFEEGIEQILAYRETRRVSGVDIATQPNAPTNIPQSAGGQAGGPGGAGGAPGSQGATNAAASEPRGGVVAQEADSQPFYIMNRQAATLTVSATDKQHRLLQQFINKIQANSSAQVLIEAKIVEVTLNEEYQSGIDWTRLGTDKVNFASTFGGVTDPGNVATFTIDQTNLVDNFTLNAAVTLAQVFGTTRTLSSPRLHAINNQQAVLTFAENQVYFELEVENDQTTSSLGTTTNTITVNSTLHTVPIGIILTLQPSINSETNEITLNVRPTLSRITGFISDPAVAFLVAQASAAGTPVDIDNQVPIIEVRELDSILKLKSGQVMVIGGLMEDRSNNTDSGVPGVSAVPWVGNLFKGVEKESNTKELVIFIRAIIVDSGGHTDKADKAVYEKFTKDPRPLNF